MGRESRVGALLLARFGAWAPVVVLLVLAFLLAANATRLALGAEETTGTVAATRLRPCGKSGSSRCPQYELAFRTADGRADAVWLDAPFFRGPLFPFAGAVGETVPLRVSTGMPLPGGGRLPAEVWLARFADLWLPPLSAAGLAVVLGVATRLSGLYR